MMKLYLLAALFAATGLAVAIPEAAPEALPEALPEAMPLAMPDALPEALAEPEPEPEPEPQQSVAVCPDWQKMVLRNHNAHRANHSAPALRYNATIAKHAQEWANKCIFAHNTSYGEGQNLALGFPAARDGINYWYNSEMTSFASEYGKPTPNLDTFGSYGHFTQVVWKGSTSVGCATKLCPSISGYTNARYVVCNYYPPGNFLGLFDKNVLRPKGAATMQSTC